MYFPPVLTLVLQLCELFRATSRCFFLNAGRRTHILRLVRKEINATRECRKLILFFIPFIRSEKKVVGKVNGIHNSVLMLSMNIFIVESPNVYQIFTSDCTLHQQTMKSRKYIAASTERSEFSLASPM